MTTVYVQQNGRDFYVYLTRTGASTLTVMRHLGMMACDMAAQAAIARAWFLGEVSKEWKVVWR